MIDEICRLTAQAGAVILRHYKQPLHVTAKADASPLTAADRASHDLICAALARLRPGVAVVSEESDTVVLAAGAPAGSYWLVDPLDGTKEFLKGTDEFTVNIALIEGGRPVLGVVYAPALDLYYYADTTSGTWRRQGNAAATRVRSRPADLTRLAVVASKDHAGPQVARLLERTPGAALKSMGSSLKFCLVAEGQADVYLRDVPTMEWDTAAAQCVVEAAGGRLTDLQGAPLTYGKPVFRNPLLMTVGDPHFAWRHLLD